MNKRKHSLTMMELLKLKVSIKELMEEVDHQIEQMKIGKVSEDVTWQYDQCIHKISKKMKQMYAEMDTIIDRAHQNV